MANRYANLVGSNKIKDEYTKINAGFDAVQAEMDAMNAELDQKADRAFARVNDLPADTKNDTITFEGGTGITITTNPNEKKVIVTATGTATPGAHGSAHTEFGADPIPLATPTTGGIMSAADKAKLDALGASVKKYGAVGDGITDDYNAFISALAENDIVIVPEPPVRYRITNTIAVGSGKKIIGIGHKPEIILDSTEVSVMFDMSDSDGVVIENLTLNGNKNVTPSGEFIRMNNSINCIIHECSINDAPSGTYGSVVLSGSAQHNRIEKCDFNNAEGIAVSLTGANVQYNIISHNKFTDSGSFGIRLGDGANRNEIVGNSTSSNGIELIGITHDCFLNRVAFNHAEGCGDNGISVTGYSNTVIGNVCRNNWGAGIWVWGSFNTIMGNECWNNNQENAANNWPGIGVSANYGGCGQFNTIIGNICDDDQASPTQWNGVRIAGINYTQWAAGQVVTAGQYRYYGLNIYFAVNSGTTGSTPPTHTSGEVSDGGVTWRYIRSFINTVGSRYNVVANNIVPRYKSGDYVDIDGNWTNNTLIAREKTDQRVSGEYRVGAGGSSAFFVNIGGTDKLRVSSAELRPETDLGLKLGLSNRQWSEVHANGYFVGGNRVVSSRRTGWSAPTGTATRTSFDTATVTTAQLAERVKALIDDLMAHGLIGT